MTKANKEPSILEISAEDRKTILEAYDIGKKGKLSDIELANIVNDYNEKKITNEKVLEIMRRYDTDGNFVIDESEVHQFKHQMDINETHARYAGYTAAFARLFRYLAEKELTLISCGSI